MNLGFLASHNGSNMQAVIDACQAGELKATPSVVISNNGDSEALARANRQAIPCYHLSSQTHPIAEQLDEAILHALTFHQVRLVILAGYMRKLGIKTLAHFAGRILNIHPALLPKFGGQGMYGAHVHAAVLAAGEKETGVTIHLVDSEYDHGSIVAQCRLPVYPGDTVTTLSQRVLEREHTFLVETLEKIIAGSISLPSKW
jgi:phosphoribosylglycinamide formyltransferase 1